MQIVDCSLISLHTMIGGLLGWAVLQQMTPAQSTCTNSGMKREHFIQSPEGECQTLRRCIGVSELFTSGGDLGVWNHSLCFLPEEDTKMAKREALNCYDEGKETCISILQLHIVIKNVKLPER